MTLFLVTVKLPQRTDHDPSNKKTGPCPIGDGVQVCTDMTGAHHTIIIYAQDREGAQLQAWLKYKHVTRIEEAG